MSGQVLLELVTPVMEAGGEGIFVPHGSPHVVQVLDHRLFHLLLNIQYRI